MFNAVTIPYESVMLLNTIRLKDGVNFDDVQLAIGEMCHVVKENYKGFIAGQVFKFDGFVSDEGTIGEQKGGHDHYAIITYWESFEEHEKSHADKLFKERFSDLAEFVSESEELGYSLLWQGEPE